MAALRKWDGFMGWPRYHRLAGCICRKLHFDCDENDYPQPSSLNISRPDLTRAVRFQELEAAANAGCWFCSILYYALANIPDWPDLQKGSTDSYITAISTLRGVKVEVNLVPSVHFFQSWEDVPQIDLESVGKRQSRQFEFYTDPSAEVPFKCKSFPIGRPVPRSTAVPEAYNFGKEMFRDCIDTHCCALPGPSLLPKRLLKIETCSGKLTINLVETNGERGHYVTLSHCWGSAPILTTTKRTLKAMKRAIPLWYLPRTFLDALYITSNLGYRFLWIDSLCILQDDLNDWELESAKMNIIYLNCAFMISADHGQDGNSGCFRDGLGTSWEVSKNGEVCWLYCRKRMTHTGLSTEVSRPLESPLSTRAWAFQERLMAPRILHYAIDEIIWECNTGVRCQCGAVAKDISSSGETYKNKLHKLEQAPDCTLEQKGQIWHAIIREYSGRVLTKSEDRLPALSGLAKRFQREEALWDEQSTETYRPFKYLDLGHYLAGLWFETLSEGLCWRTFDEHESNGAFKAIVAKEPPVEPSWSWTSVSETVYFSGKGTDVQIHDARCTPASLDPTGAVSGGCIDISGSAKECYLYYEEDVFLQGLKKKGLRYYLCLTGESSQPKDYPHYLYLSFDGGIRPKKRPGFGEYAVEEVLAFQMNASFALLLRCLTQERFQYERIGCLSGYAKDLTLQHFFENARKRRIMLI